jgi:hypothetical protein
MNFTSTSLPETNDPIEIRKAVLDLLDKINQVAASVDKETDTGLSAVDSTNNIVHQIPSGPLGDYYYMGHLYLHQSNPQKYLIYNGAVTRASWNTTQAVIDSNTNVRGILLVTTLSITPFADTSLFDMYMSLRPSGCVASDYNAGSFPSFAEAMAFNTRYTSNVIMGVWAQGHSWIFDIALGGNNQFDIRADWNPPTATGNLIVQQLGVWV